MNRIKVAENMVDDILNNNFNAIKQVETIANKIMDKLSEADEDKDKGDDSVNGGKYKKFFSMMKSKGMNDENKMKGMLSRAKEIAAKQGKPNDEKTIIGIMQGFLGGK